MLVIEVKAYMNHGLETYKVIVNGTVLNEFMSLEFAEAKKRAYIKAWNIGKLGKKVA